MVIEKRKQTMNKLPQFPTRQDLYKYSKIRLRKKRLIKKFNSNWAKYVSDDIFVEFMAKVFSAILYRKMDYQEIGRQLFSVEPLPEGAFAVYDKEDK